MASLRDQVDAALASARATGLGRAARRAARVPRRLLGARRRRARRRRRAPAGGALRPLPRPAGRARAERARSRQGPDRPRLRRAHFWDTEASSCPSSPTRAHAAATRCAGATRPSTSPGARAQLRPRRRGVPVAHDPRPGVLRLLAGRHRRLPHQRRHRRRGAAATCSHRRRRVRTRRRARAAGGDRAAVALAGHHDAPGAFRIDGVTGPDEYSAIADNNVYTNLMAAAEPGRRRGRRCARHRRPGRRRSASTRRRSPRGATRPRAMRVPYDDELGVHPQSEGFTGHERWDFEATHARAVPAAAALPLLRPLSQAGGQAGRPRARAVRRAAIASRARRRRATSPTTRR